MLGSVVVRLAGSASEGIRTSTNPATLLRIRDGRARSYTVRRASDHSLAKDDLEGSDRHAGCMSAAAWRPDKCKGAPVEVHAAPTPSDP